eukprot:scaffold102907_cov34-Tisochrysis_lutea.AAC.2
MATTFFRGRGTSRTWESRGVSRGAWAQMWRIQGKTPDRSTADQQTGDLQSAENPPHMHSRSGARA